MSDQSSQDGRSKHNVGATADVTEDSPVVTAIDGIQIAVFHAGDDYFALNNVCPHQEGPLAEGTVEDDCVYCPWHGWQFDLESGEHVHGDDEAETYPVSVEDDELYVEL